MPSLTGKPTIAREDLEELASKSKNAKADSNDIDKDGDLQFS